MKGRGVPALSARLRAVASFVTEGNRLADIGTDHAYLPIALCADGIIPSAIAADLREGPLEAAGAHVREAGLSERICLRLSDGLAGFKEEEADTVVIAGMGGPLIASLLQRSPFPPASIPEWIFEPQSDASCVRSTLEAQGLCIDQERMVREEGKYYPVIRAVPAGAGERRMTEAELIYGPCLLRDRDPVLQELLLRDRERTNAILQALIGNDSETAQHRVQELREEKRLIETALAYYEM